MDHLIYTAMTGAKHLLNQQAVVSNNLANANTTGFRAETTAFRVAPLTPGRPGEGLQTRYFAVESTPGFDQTPGALQQTGRDLDVAIDGPGWLAVQADDGSESYTRDGHLQIDPNGVITTAGGRPVLGEGGPINVPPDYRVSIGGDGTVSASLPGQSNAIIQLGRFKLVNPEPGSLIKGDDGLVRTRTGTAADADPNVRIAAGALEGSNVNSVETLVSMISLARQFDLQLQLIKNADQNSQASQKLLGST